MKLSTILGSIVALIVLTGLVVLLTCTFIIDEREQAVVTRFNRPIRVIVGDIAGTDFEQLKQEILATAARTAPGEGGEADTLRVSRGPGLYFKMPFVDTVERFPDTVLEYDAEPEELYLADKKILTVDNFAWWRIRNPLLYRVRVRTEVGARGVLDDIIYSSIRSELGQNTLTEVIRTTNKYVSPERSQEEAERNGEEVSSSAAREEIERGRETIMRAVTAASNEAASTQYGIEVLAVRIKRADLVKENLEAVFSRMEAERERISKGYLSEGQKEARIIRSQTDRDVKVMVANAEKEAEITRGQADAEVARIFGEAFNTDPDLYRYLKSLEVLRNDTPAGSEFIIGLDSGVFKFLNGD